MVTPLGKGTKAILLYFLLLQSGIAFTLSPFSRKTPIASRYFNNDDRVPFRLQASQVLQFVEPETGVSVTLVGSMHYNPASILLATKTIQDLADENQLGAVIIESCDIRYESSKSISPFLRSILRSEMTAACRVALEYGRPVILGDQRINVTIENMKSAFIETVQDLVQPQSGGWNRIGNNLTQAWKDATAAPNEAPNLTLWSILDPGLLLASPVSLVKYPLSYLTRSPLVSLSVMFLLGLLIDLGNNNSDMALAAALTDIDDHWSWNLIATELVSLFIAILETVVFARIILKEILHDRNVVLAQSILTQCRLYEQSSPKKRAWTSSLLTLIPSLPNTEGITDDGVNYVKPKREDFYGAGSSSSRSTAKGSKGEKTVVAVVGMAHCNGIKKLLQEREI